MDGPEPRVSFSSGEGVPRRLRKDGACRIEIRVDRMAEIIILEAARTTFGRFGVALRWASPTDLGIASVRVALARSMVPPDAVDYVEFGNFVQSSAVAV